MKALPSSIPVISFDNIVEPSSVITMTLEGAGALHIVADSFKNQGYIGLLQPLPNKSHKFCQFGMLGRIIETEEVNKFNICLTIETLREFRIKKFIKTEYGFIKAKIGFDTYTRALSAFDKQYLIKFIENYLRKTSLSLDVFDLEKQPLDYIIGMLMRMYPFNPVEKKCLLETQSLNEKTKIIKQILSADKGSELLRVVH